MSCADQNGSGGVLDVGPQPSMEQSFLYGNHVLKGGLGRMTENTPKYQASLLFTSVGFAQGQIVGSRHAAFSYCSEPAPHAVPDTHTWT